MFTILVIVVLGINFPTSEKLDGDERKIAWLLIILCFTLSLTIDYLAMVSNNC